MKNVRVVYYGARDVLHLTMFHLSNGKEVVTRLDNFLPQECQRHRDDLLVLGMDDRIINIGMNVPIEVVERVVKTNPSIDDGYTGFMVPVRPGYKIVDVGPSLMLKKIEEPVKPVVLTETQIRESPIDLVKAVNEISKAAAQPEPKPEPPKPTESRGDRKRKRKDLSAATDPVFTKLAEGL